MGKRAAASKAKIDHEVTDVDVFEHAMRGVPLSQLIAVLRKFAKNSAALPSYSAAFTVTVEAIASTA